MCSAYRMQSIGSIPLCSGGGGPETPTRFPITDKRHLINCGADETDVEDANLSGEGMGITARDSFGKAVFSISAANSISKSL